MPLSRNGTIDVEFGNAGKADTQATGWFIGFSEWATGLRHMPIEDLSSGLCVKWFEHAAGHPNGDAKPLSEGRTISMLVGASSEFKIQCSLDASFPEDKTVTHVLRKTGDYVIWGPGIYHRTFGIKQATILTLRWTPK